MTENRPSVQRIVDAWSERYDRKFSSAVRKDAVVELVMDLVAHGYDRPAIERAKLLAMEEMVGTRSKFGNLKDWKRNASKDYDRAVREVFEPLGERSGPVEVKFTPSTISEEERIEQEKRDLEALKALNEELSSPVQSSSSEEESSDIQQDEDLVFDGEPVIRPELDRTRFKNVQTTPMMSEEDFFALLEREQNER